MKRFSPPILKSSDQKQSNVYLKRLKPKLYNDFPPEIKTVNLYFRISCKTGLTDVVWYIWQNYSSFINIDDLNIQFR